MDKEDLEYMRALQELEELEDITSDYNCKVDLKKYKGGYVIDVWADSEGDRLSIEKDLDSYDFNTTVDVLYPWD